MTVKSVIILIYVTGISLIIAYDTAVPLACFWHRFVLVALFVPISPAAIACGEPQTYVYEARGEKDFKNQMS